MGPEEKVSFFLPFQELSLLVWVGKCSQAHIRPLFSVLLFPPLLHPLFLSLAAIRYFIPSFGGKSYLAFKMMKAYHTVRIAMEFRTVELSGLLLYNGQNRGKDFISLALVGGFVELRWVPFPSALCGVEEEEQPLLPEWFLQNTGRMLGSNLLAKKQ